MSLAAAKVVAVFPAAELERRRRLFAALEEAFPVRFERREAGLRGADAVLEIGGDEHAAEASSVGLPALAMLLPESPLAGEPREQSLSNVAELDERLRGAALPDLHLGEALGQRAQLAAAKPSLTFAQAGASPTWVRTGKLDKALIAPNELGEEEALRERLCNGRSAALLPLVHFLRELTAPSAWQPPAARASLLFDDPNLHWPSYGFLALPELAAHARAHGYHVALATVPLDAWFAHPGALRALRDSAGAISLLVHGNDHNGGELGRPASAERSLRVAAQALRRVERFRHRTGIAVDTVMAPPHEQCSEATAVALRRCGFEAITMTRPFAWLAEPPQSWLSRPRQAGPLVGWGPADFPCGMPVLLRHPLIERDAAELVLRAFLDQPLILYGHHGDVAGGLDVLAAAAADVNRLRETRWCSLAEIAASNFETRLAGTRLHVRPHARRVRVEVPDGIDEVVVELPGTRPQPMADRVTVGGRRAHPDEPVDVGDASTVQIELHAKDDVEAKDLPVPAPQPLALARRALGEGRDRLVPLLARAR